MKQLLNIYDLDYIKFPGEIEKIKFTLKVLCDEINELIERIDKLEK